MRAVDQYIAFKFVRHGPPPNPTTGGTLDSESDLSGIEKSYARIAAEARNQYTIVYASHEPLIDGKYRKIEIRVDRPGVEVIAKKGYYPSGQDYQR